MNAGGIVGGVFGLEELRDGKGTPPAFLREGHIRLASARCGMHLLIHALAPARTWLPSYLCPAMLQAVDREITEPHFYAIDERLECHDRVWMADVRPRDLVFFIDYFGFPFDRSLSAEAKSRGAWVAEDASQALLLAEPAPSADFVLMSPRKFMGVPDGGILWVRGEVELGDPMLEVPPADWLLRAVAVAAQRREFDRHGGERGWFPLFRAVEETYPIGRFAMSDLSSAILECGMDWGDMRQRRRENYAALYETLGHLALLGPLDDDVVPLGFPVRMANREAVRQQLFAANIYPPIHWELGSAVPVSFKASHALSQSILSLPCDQRYDVADMDRLAAAVRGAGALPHARGGAA